MKQSPSSAVAAGLRPGFEQLLEQLVSGPVTLEGAGQKDYLRVCLARDSWGGGQLGGQLLAKNSHAGSPSTWDPPLSSKQRDQVGTGAYLRQSCPGQFADITEPWGTGKCSRNGVGKGTCMTRAWGELTRGRALSQTRWA